MTTDGALLGDALALIDHWPADRAAAAVVTKDGTAVHGDTDRAFPLASVTKLLTAYTALVAVEEGTLALDEPAGPPGATVAHLLAHASGLGFLAGDGVLMAPERRRVYSNAGIEVVAERLAERAGLPFWTYAAEAVFEPLGMTGVVAKGSPAWQARATIGDLAAFARELLTPTLISRATLDRATTVVFPGLAGVLPGFGRRDPNDWGLGFELRDGKSPHWTGTRNAPSTFGHFGQSGTFLWVDPAARLACGVLTNRDFGPWAAEAWPAFSDAVLAATPGSGA